MSILHATHLCIYNLCIQGVITLSTIRTHHPSSRTFTVTFQSKQANLTVNAILLADDSIVEGTEAFCLRIVAARFFGQAAVIFRAEDGLTNTVAGVTIEDDDCKITNTTSIICL